jgi:hypothetical protein
VAILKKKAEAEEVPLPDNVAMFVASKIKSNIRELEGSLVRLIAYASLTGRDISVELAQEVLKNVVREDTAVTIEMVQKKVADYYGLKVADLKARDNSKSVAMPRQVAMYLCKQAAHLRLAAGDRSGVRREAPLDGHPLHPQGGAVEAEQPGFQQDHQRLHRLVEVSRMADPGPDGEFSTGAGSTGLRTLVDGGSTRAGRPQDRG